MMKKIDAGLIFFLPFKMKTMEKGKLNCEILTVIWGNNAANLTSIYVVCFFC